MTAVTIVRPLGGSLVEGDLSGFSCQNVECPDHGKKGMDNLTIDSCYGRQKQYRLLVCRTCRKRFSERKGTTLFGSQLTVETIARISAYLAENKSVREVARLTGVNRNTVVRYSHLLRDTQRDRDR